MVLSSLVLVAGGVYWLVTVRPVSDSESTFEMSNPLRLAIWNLAGSRLEPESSAPSATELAKGIAQTHVSLWILFGLPNGTLADEVAQQMGRGWRATSLRHSDEYIAVLAGPEVPPTERRLVSLGQGDDALMVSFVGPLQRTIRVLGLAVPLTSQFEGSGIAQRLVALSEREPEGLLILAGSSKDPTESAPLEKAAEEKQNAGVRRRFQETFRPIPVGSETRLNAPEVLKMYSTLKRADRTRWGSPREWPPERRGTMPTILEVDVP